MTCQLVVPDYFPDTLRIFSSSVERLDVPASPLNRLSYLFRSLVGSPYTTQLAAYMDIYYYTVMAIKASGLQVKVGGPGKRGNRADNNGEELPLCIICPMGSWTMLLQLMRLA